MATSQEEHPDNAETLEFGNEGEGEVEQENVAETDTEGEGEGEEESEAEIDECVDLSEEFEIDLHEFSVKEETKEDTKVEEKEEPPATQVKADHEDTEVQDLESDQEEVGNEAEGTHKAGPNSKVLV